MRAYIVITGVLFGLLTAAHIWRVFVEGAQMMRDPFFSATTVIAGALCVWAWWLARSAARR